MNRLLIVTLLFLSFVTHGEEMSKPNIIFVLADDLGWAELGCYGNEFNETPHLDALAKEGMRFTNAYASAPVCSPYRVSLLTGLVPARVGITDYLRPNSANALSTSHITLAEMFRRNGYATGMVGKWHLTGYKHHGAEFEIRPRDHGFDWNIGSEVKGVGNGANTWPYVFRDQGIRWLDLPENRLGEKEYLTDRLNLEAVDFVERSVADGNPFFLYLSHYAPHTILNGRDDLVDKYRRKHPPGKSGRENCYICEDAGLGKGDPGNHWAVDHNPHLAAMLESIDDGIGMLVAKLDELGISDNTIVIFTSDNGGERNVTSNAPLRGGKSQLYEGGIRVPLVVRWPDRIPSKVVSENATMNTDFYPTLLEAAGIEPDPEQILDGISVLSNWEDPDNVPERDFLAWHYPLDRPHFLGGVSGGAIRSGGWKLVEHFDSGKDELYSLRSDISESDDVSEHHPETVSELKRKLAEWRESVGGATPSPPFLLETRNLYFGDHFSDGLVSERLRYSKDWVAEDGVLKRLETGSDTTRIFLRDAEFTDALIRFKFRMGEATDIRLVTGNGGAYNAVLHIREDHFFLQTASDKSVPWFSYRHGECAFDFDPEKWYTMTVEFLDDEVVAHINRERVVYAKHPIIDQTRKYLALQVDEKFVCFDDFQVFTAASKKGDALDEGRAGLDAVLDRYPVPKSLEEEYQIEKRNAHEKLYQSDEFYRGLVKRVQTLDEKRKEQFPGVFLSTKDRRSAIGEERKRLLKSDPIYKELLHATHRSKRALETFLIEQKPEIENWPRSKKEAELERLRRRFATSDSYEALLEQSAKAEAELKSKYPQLYLSDEALAKKKKAVFAAANEGERFKLAAKERASAYQDQQEYLHRNDGELARISALREEVIQK